MEEKIRVIKEKAVETIDADAMALADTKLSKTKRKQAYKNIMDRMLNPVPEADFNPETFDAMDDDPEYEIKKRNRTEPPKRLPTKGLKPKQILEGQMVGMFESKQDLYLLIAWLSERVTDLEEQLKTTENL